MEGRVVGGPTGALRADHLIHLRCEVSDTETPALVAANIDKPLVKVASVMNHAPGDRQSPDVERYIARPGQALSYKIGMLKIQELRAKAEEALGDNFDIRDYHDVVLQNGAVPLPVLERLVDAYIEEKGGGQ